MRPSGRLVNKEPRSPKVNNKKRGRIRSSVAEEYQGGNVGLLGGDRTLTDS